MERFYQAGLIPFAVYVNDAPREATFVWQAKIHLWQKQNRFPILCSFPRLSADTEHLTLPPAGVLLDMTALLTLGGLRATREILQVLGQNSCPVFLFPGARGWLKTEVSRLSFAQLPEYRERPRRLRELLRSSRERVDIINSNTIHQQDRAYIEDIELATTRGILCLDDRPADGQGAPADQIVIHSSDLLLTLERMGLVLPEVAEHIRHSWPRPFRDSTTGVDISLDQPIMFSAFALGDWHQTGLLEDWLKGNAGWPPKIVVGPEACSILDQNVTEGYAITSL